MPDRVLHIRSVALVVIGVLLAAFGLAADGIGLGGAPGIGRGQAIAMLVGVAAAGLGFFPAGAAMTRSRGFLVLLGLGGGLSLAEVVLHQVERRERASLDKAMAGIGYRVPDPRLGFRIAPGAPGHDGRGFRNARALERADIVATGDSQTWGNGAATRDAWPQALGRMSGRPAYNMGVGGYGPVQYLAMCREATNLQPRIVVVGLYFGNDIWDAYSQVYRSETCTELRAAEAGDLLADTITARTTALTDEAVQYQERYQRSRAADPLMWMGLHSAIVRGLARAGIWPARFNADYQAQRAWSHDYPEHGSAYEQGPVCTVLTPAYRLCAEDLDDPRIVEGLRITLEMLSGIRTEGEARGEKMLVVLIPTKELVYADAMRSSPGGMSESYSKLIAMEGRLRGAVMSHCRQIRLEYADALPSLEAAVQRKERIYPVTGDGHPVAKGYSLIASSVNEALNRLGWL